MYAILFKYDLIWIENIFPCANILVEQKDQIFTNDCE